MMCSLVGVTLVVFPSIINSLIENLDGIIIGILIVLGSIFALFYLMKRKKNKNNTNKIDQETNEHNAKTSEGDTFLRGDFGGGDGGSRGGG